VTTGPNATELEHRVRDFAASQVTTGPNATELEHRVRDFAASQVTTGPNATELEHRVRDFAARWLRIVAPGLGDALLSDPILVLGPQGTPTVTRGAFLAAVAGREATANAADTATTLTATTVSVVGDRLLLATMTWSFRHGTDEVNLVSDCLLQREDDDRLRCFAYLPRTNVLDHLC
jgi:hypothetical protein